MTWLIEEKKSVYLLIPAKSLTKKHYIKRKHDEKYVEDFNAK